MADYKTSAGDTFDLIAFKQLGSCQYTDNLINANRNLVDTLIFKAGITITIPTVPSSAANLRLPPWKT